MSSISDIILKRTDTTHDLSQKAEKRYSQNSPEKQASSDMTRHTRDGGASQEAARANAQVSAHGEHSGSEKTITAATRIKTNAFTIRHFTN